MSATTTIQQLNREAADKVLQKAKENPRTYAGKFVGIANGRVVAIVDRLDEIGPRLRQVEPDRSKTHWIEISSDGTEVCYIWGGF